MRFLASRLEKVRRMVLIDQKGRCSFHLFALLYVQVKPSLELMPAVSFLEIQKLRRPITMASLSPILAASSGINLM